MMTRKGDAYGLAAELYAMANRLRAITPLVSDDPLDRYEARARVALARAQGALSDAAGQLDCHGQRIDGIERDAA